MSAVLSRSTTMDVSLIDPTGPKLLLIGSCPAGQKTSSKYWFSCRETVVDQRKVRRPFSTESSGSANVTEPPTGSAGVAVGCTVGGRVFVGAGVLVGGSVGAVVGAVVGVGATVDVGAAVDVALTVAVGGIGVAVGANVGMLAFVAVAVGARAVKVATTACSSVA